MIEIPENRARFYFRGGGKSHLSRFYRAVKPSFEEKLTIWIDEASTIDEKVLEALRTKAETAIKMQVQLNMKERIDGAVSRAKGAKPARP